LQHVVVHPDLGGLAGEEELDAMDCKLFALQVRVMKNAGIGPILDCYSLIRSLFSQ